MPKVMWTKNGVCEKMEQSHADLFRGVAITPLKWSLKIGQTCLKDDLIEWTHLKTSRTFLQGRVKLIDFGTK